MNIFCLSPEYDALATKLAAKADAPVFAVDADDASSMDVGDLMTNIDDNRLYKVAEMESSPEDGSLVFVKVSEAFSMGAEEFNETMRKIAQMEDTERRHQMADALMSYVLKQAAPEYAWGAREFEGMGKWYA